MGEAGWVVVESVGAEGAGVVNMVWYTEPTAVEHWGCVVRCKASQTSNLSAVGGGDDETRAERASQDEVNARAGMPQGSLPGEPARQQAGERQGHGTDLCGRAQTDAIQTDI